MNAGVLREHIAGDAASGNPTRSRVTTAPEFATLLASSILILGSAPEVYAWSDRGHSVVAEIAQRHLEPGTAAAVEELLGDRRSLASVSSWADDFKFTPEGLGTQTWHFVNIDIAHDAYEPPDCPESGCLVSALRDQSAILGDPAQLAANRARALLLLVHLVGDSVQPFHCGQRDGDAGGNAVRIDFNGVGPDGKPRLIEGLRLHALWDETLIDAHTWSWGGYADTLDKLVAPSLPPISLEGDWAVAWANECHATSREMYALVPVGTTELGPDYQVQVQPVLDRQLAIGGLRLSTLLNALLPGS